MKTIVKTLELKLKKHIIIVEPDKIENINAWIRIYSEYGDFLCKGSELTEEIASDFFEYDDFLNCFEAYIDTVPSIDKSALKLFIKIFESKGFYWLENPVKIHTWASENADEYRKKWQEAEEKTFKNPLIFVKK